MIARPGRLTLAPTPSGVRWLGGPLVAALAAALVAGYTWLWVGVLTEEPRQQVLAVNPHFVPSDFFMPWYGARGLVAGRNPYDDAFYRELHRAYYGAELDASSGVSHLAGFYYPPYVLLPLLPFVWLPFAAVRWLAAIGLGLALVAGAWLWDGVLGAAQTWRRRLAVAIFALLFAPSINTLVFQQLSGLIMVYLAAAYAAAANRRYTWAGVLLALATIKPQIVLVPAAGLLFWALWRRERWRTLFAFGGTMAAQLALSEYLLPGWLGHFLPALERRRATNPEFWLPGQIAGGATLGAVAVAGLLLALLAHLWWRHRAAPIAAPAALRTAALGFAIGLTVVPDVGLYNRVLLVMPILALASAGPGRTLFRRATTRLAALVLVGQVAVIGALAWLRWLAPGVAPAPAVLDVVDAINVGLPVFLVPALAALCFEPGAGQRGPAHPRV